MVQPRKQQRDLHNQMRKLEEKNRKLKESLGKKELESELKDELLKKRHLGKVRNNKAKNSIKLSDSFWLSSMEG